MNYGGSQPRYPALCLAAAPDAAARTRQAVLDAARELFAAQGYTATTIEQIARRAGVSKPTVFAAVGSKQAILKQLRDIALAGDGRAGTRRSAPLVPGSAWPNPTRAAPCACTRATPPPSTAGLPTCTRVLRAAGGIRSGPARPVARQRGRTARRRGDRRRRPPRQEPPQGGTGPRRRHRHRVGPHRQ